MTLWVLGLNHQTAPVELRERAAFAGEALPRALGSLRDTPQIAEAVLLSTCNRTELYAEADDGGEALARWLAEKPEWVRGKRVLDFAAGLSRGLDAQLKKLKGVRNFILLPKGVTLAQDQLDAIAESL